MIFTINYVVVLIIFYHWLYNIKYLKLYNYLWNIWVEQSQAKYITKLKTKFDNKLAYDWSEFKLLYKWIPIIVTGYNDNRRCKVCQCLKQCWEIFIFTIISLTLFEWPANNYWTKSVQQLGNIFSSSYWLLLLFCFFVKCVNKIIPFEL